MPGNINSIANKTAFVSGKGCYILSPGRVKPPLRLSFDVYCLRQSNVRQSNPIEHPDQEFDCVRLPNVRLCLIG